MKIDLNEQGDHAHINFAGEANVFDLTTTPHVQYIITNLYNEKFI